MLIPQVGSTLAGLAFVLTSITSVIASSVESEVIQPESTHRTESLPQCLNRELASAKEEKKRCEEQVSNGGLKTSCSIMKSKVECNKPLVEAAVNCSPSSGSVFHWLNEFEEEFYCAGKSIAEQQAFSEKTDPCDKYFRPENAPEECKDAENHEAIWFQSPPEVCTSAKMVFNCFNTALSRCGWSGQPLSQTSFATAMHGSGCPSSASNPFVPTSMTVLWWTLVISGLSWLSISSASQ